MQGCVRFEDQKGVSQGRGKGKGKAEGNFFGRGIARENLTRFNVAQIQILNKSANFFCFGRSKGCP